MEFVVYVVVTDFGNKVDSMYSCKICASNRARTLAADIPPDCAERYSYYQEATLYNHIPDKYL